MIVFLFSFSFFVSLLVLKLQNGVCTHIDLVAGSNLRHGKLSLLLDIQSYLPCAVVQIIEMYTSYGYFALFG